MTETTGIPAGKDEGVQAFLRYLPMRITAFERRIMRYRFGGWEPSGMMVLGGDLQRLADASDRYGLVETHRHLLTLAQTVREHVSSMRSPDPQQTTRLFSLLTAVVKSLPAAAPPPPRVAPTVAAPPAPAVAAPAQATPAPIAQEAPAEPAHVDSAPASEEPELHVDEMEPALAATIEAIEPTLAPTIEASEPALAVTIESTATVASSDPNAAEPAIAATDHAELATHAAAIELDTAIPSPTAIETAEPAATFELAVTEEEPEATIASIRAEAASESAESVEALAPPEEVEPSAAVEGVALPEAAEPAAATEAAVSSAASAAIETSDSSSSIPDLPPTPDSPSSSPASESLAELDEPAATDDPIDEFELEANTDSDGGVRRIYHLSDGNAFALELEKHLEAEGYAIEPVESLGELSELLLCMMPQVLLVDPSHLAELTEIGTLCRDAQKRSQPPRRIQMAVLAAQDNLETRRLAHRAGVDQLLFPPFELTAISERLQLLRSAAMALKPRVLIVEDNRTDALYAQTVLTNAGMHAQVEEDPLRVLDALRALHPDLVLMDLHMPFANGVEVTMLIREQPMFAHLPIVFLSGESDPDSQLEAINAGGDDFLFKPIRPRHLIDAVRDRMRRLHRVREQSLT